MIMVDDNNTGHIDYDTDDTKYGGAQAVVLKELEDLENRRQSDPENLKALALSGGGIRSASFCLGVLQVLAKGDKLEKIDYLSTVSGGGYLGGSLSWLWLDKWKNKTGCKKNFGTQSDNFPFGTGNRHSNPDPDMDKDQASLMRHLRQHGKYLIPGKGITILSFLSVVLRSITMGFVTLIVLVSLLFHLLYYTPAFEPGWYLKTKALDVGVFAMVAYIICLLIYGYFAIYNKKKAMQAYLGRRNWETYIKYVLIVAVIILTVALIVELRRYLFESAGGLSALTGSLLAWYSQKSDKESIFKFIPKSWLVHIGVIVMFIGLFVLSDQLADALINTEISFKEQNIVIHLHILVAIIVLISAWLIPINKVSIHRYYRDRLMETFMPDACNIFSSGEAYVAIKANETSLHKCRPDEDNKMPYHIINTNLILVESEIAKFRGRGGDNFILSPLYSGSSATGWRDSKEFAGDSITLPTAVAISGAAANSDSGVAGKGLTMNPLISALMNIFNLRLGYWTVNPNPRYQTVQNTNPNYLKPGFRGILSRKKLNEQADFVQLSDGGHFENLAMYELIRRRCRLIICCDAEQDNNFTFESLINIIEKSRIDFGVTIDITSGDLDELKYSQNDNNDITYAKQGYLIADITYPDKTSGQLIYVKTTLTDNLPVDIMRYKNAHSDFPDETTIDQFFDEKQFEAYRRLGIHIAQPILNDLTINW